MRFRLLLFVVFASGCARPHDEAEQRALEVGVPTLRAAAAVLYKDHFAVAGADFRPIPASRWPPAFLKLKPWHVAGYLDGFAVALEVRGSAQSGLYIIPEGMEHAPAPNPRVRFLQLQPGLYWYAIEP